MYEQVMALRRREQSISFSGSASGGRGWLLEDAGDGC